MIKTICAATKYKKNYVVIGHINDTSLGIGIRFIII